MESLSYAENSVAIIVSTKFYPLAGTSQKLLLQRFKTKKRKRKLVYPIHIIH